MDENKNEYSIILEDNSETLERTKKAQSAYLDHYDNATSKISAVNELISIKNEIARQNKQTDEGLRDELRHFESVKNGDDGDHWMAMINAVVSLASGGYKIKRESQYSVMKLTESLNLPEITNKRVKLTLMGCSSLAEKRLRENNIEHLLTYVIENDYPPNIPIPGHSPSKNNGFIGPHKSRVKNIIHNMAMRRSGPDKRSKYKYDEIADALTKKYDNPGMTWSALGTPIKENTFSKMWTALQEEVDKIDTKELD